MASVNKWIGIGNLGSDPKTSYMPNGDAVANISMACTESWKDKTTGEKKESTEWVRVVFYRKLAEIVSQYLKKGASVYVEGRIRTRKWQDKEGQDRYTTEIEASSMQMLGVKYENIEEKIEPKEVISGKTGFEDMSDDVPF